VDALGMRGIIKIILKVRTIRAYSNKDLQTDKNQIKSYVYNVGGAELRYPGICLYLYKNQAVANKIFLF